MAAPSSPAARATTTPLAVVERAAWRIPWSTRRLLVVLALVTGTLLASSGLVAARVASRNSGTIADASAAGLGMAQAATDFRTNLAAADAEAAATLISGGLEDPERRGRYDADVLGASRALTDAGLAATAEDAADVAALADGLVRYAGLVETSRANSRQGFPVGSAYLNQARALAGDDLVPRAERLRRAGEQRIARAANHVGGAYSALASALLLVALLMLVLAAVLVAGRTRRIAHPAGIAALIAVLVLLVVVVGSISTQRSELRAAATTDFDAYVAANDAASTISDLRVVEIGAVGARGSGAPLYERFRTESAALVDGLRGDRTNAQLAGALDLYVAAVAEVESIDTEGDNRLAATSTLDGSSAANFLDAADAAQRRVDATAADLADRFEAATAAAVDPLVPTALGIVGAALAVGGVLARARRYR